MSHNDTNTTVHNMPPSNNEIPPEIMKILLEYKQMEEKLTADYNQKLQVMNSSWKIKDDTRLHKK